VREMAAKGYVTEKKDKKDGRKNVISLANKGKEITERIGDQYTDVRSVIEEVLSQTRNDLWKAIEEWEYLLQQKTLFRRVKEHRKTRESGNVKIVSYQANHREDFKKLNEEWISTYFKMENADHEVLDDPQGYILDKGGHILVALYNARVVGVCALIKMDDPDYDYELAKMAVAPKAQGKNIGWLLGQAIIQKAKSLGASKIYLGSNTILQPALNLYNKLGFQKIAGHPTPYERCNIQMELIL
jgi:GNAT superfamily N-acetyltransferase